MTPIRPKYYGGTSAPNECLNPIPVTFLSIRGTFRFYVRPENLQDPLALQWADYGLQLCCQALSLWGIGGKTRAGYGRMRA
jgi:CRISPR-associated protein Cmr6